MSTWIAVPDDCEVILSAELAKLRQAAAEQGTLRAELEAELKEWKLRHRLLCDEYDRNRERASVLGQELAQAQWKLAAMTKPPGELLPQP